MERIRTIRRGGREILVTDYTGLPAHEHLALMKEAKELICCFPPRSVLALQILRDTDLERRMPDAVTTFIADTAPYVRSVAIVGMNPFQLAMFESQRPSDPRAARAFGDEQAALEWLAPGAREQPAADEPEVTASLPLSR